MYTGKEKSLFVLGKCYIFIKKSNLANYNNQIATKKKKETQSLNEFVHFEFKYILLTSSRQHTAIDGTWQCRHGPTSSPSGYHLSELFSCLKYGHFISI